MPDAAGMTLADLTQWVRGLMANPRPVPAEHFFQSRTTHTPGGFAPMDPAMAGGFDPGVSPAAAVASSDLPPDVKQKLIAQWQRSPRGFITMPAGAGTPRSDVMRHEELHALQKSAGLEQHAKDIASRVSPDIAGLIRSLPVYQGESKVYGPDVTMADEGSAMDLISMANRAGGPSKELKSYISGLLGPKQQKQLEELTAPR